MRLVLVEWLDSERRDDWEPLNSIRSSSLRCRSVGWLASDTDEAKTIFPHLDADGKQGCGGMTIPTRAVLNIQDIALPAVG